jgi:ketosteroid isomerase-like protein
MARTKPSEALLMASSDDAERQFYESLQRGDIDRLMAVWSDDDEVVCVHPGGPRVVGVVAIRAAFDAMFANGVIDAHPEKTRKVVTPSSAVHSVLERIQVMTEEGPHSAWVVATNVYNKTVLGWRLVAHHASPGSPREMPDISELPSVLH